MEVVFSSITDLSTDKITELVYKWNRIFKKYLISKDYGGDIENIFVIAKCTYFMDQLGLGPIKTRLFRKDKQFLISFDIEPDKIIESKEAEYEEEYLKKFIHGVEQLKSRKVGDLRHHELLIDLKAIIMKHGYVDI